MKTISLNCFFLIALVLCSCTSLIRVEKKDIDKKPDVRPRTVFMDCDGNIDDYIALITALRMKHINLIGVSVTPADCLLEAGVEGVLKILSLLKKDVPVRGSTEAKLLREFPYFFKLVGVKANLLPQMLIAEANQKLYDTKEPSHIHMAKTIKASKEPVTVLLTGPATTFVMAYKYDKNILKNVEEVVWMGGAVDANGNVFADAKSDGSAEWNIFTDPVSAKDLLTNEKINVTLFPLDATNSLPMSRKLISDFALQQKYQISSLVSQMFAVAYFESENKQANEKEDYYLWDVTAAGYLGCENMATFKDYTLDVKTDGLSFGKTFKTVANGTNPHTVKVATQINQQRFLTYLYRLMLAD